MLLLKLDSDHGHIAAREHAKHGAGHAVLLAQNDMLIRRDVDVDGFARLDAGGPSDLQQDAAPAEVAGMGGNESCGRRVKELDRTRGEHARAAALIAGATGGDRVRRQEVRAHGRALSEYLAFRRGLAA